MKKTAAARAVVNLRRAYLESRYGQLHVRTAFPSTGGFDERTALVLLHPCPHSSRRFARFLPLIATDRSVYAADTPGFGESDPPPAAPTIAEYAAAIADFLDHLRLRQVDVLGWRDGAAIAAELAILRPQTVRRAVLVGVPMHSGAERADFAARPYPLPPVADGRHLIAEWQRAQAEPAPGRTLATLAAEVAEALHAGPNAWWGGQATRQWAAAERLPLVAAPTLVLRPRDELWEASARARSLLRQATLEDLAEQGAAAFDVAPEAIAARVRAFLDR